jgi:hypothetical protein
MCTFPSRRNETLLAQLSRDLILDPGRQCLPSASFTSVNQLAEQIHAFIEAYIRDPTPPRLGGCQAPSAPFGRRRHRHL